MLENYVNYSKLLEAFKRDLNRLSLTDSTHLADCTAEIRFDDRLDGRSVCDTTLWCEFLSRECDRKPLAKTVLLLQLYDNLSRIQWQHCIRLISALTDGGTCTLCVEELVCVLLLRVLQGHAQDMMRDLTASPDCADTLLTLLLNLYSRNVCFHHIRHRDLLTVAVCERLSSSSRIVEFLDVLICYSHICHPVIDAFLNCLLSVIHRSGDSDQVVILFQKLLYSSFSVKTIQCLTRLMVSSNHLSVTPSISPDHLPVTPSISPGHLPVTPCISPDRLPVTPSISPDHLPVTPSISPDHLPVTPCISPGHLSVTPSISPGHLPVTPCISPGHLSVTPSISLGHPSVTPSISPDHLPVTPSISPDHLLVDENLHVFQLSCRLFSDTLACQTRTQRIFQNLQCSCVTELFESIHSCLCAIVSPSILLLDQIMNVLLQFVFCHKSLRSTDTNFWTALIDICQLIFEFSKKRVFAPEDNCILQSLPKRCAACIQNVYILSRSDVSLLWNAETRLHRCLNLMQREIDDEFYVKYFAEIVDFNRCEFSNSMREYIPSLLCTYIVSGSTESIQLAALLAFERFCINSRSFTTHNHMIFHAIGDIVAMVRESPSIRLQYVCVALMCDFIRVLLDRLPSDSRQMSPHNSTPPSLTHLLVEHFHTRWRCSSNCDVFLSHIHAQAHNCHQSMVHHLQMMLHTGYRLAELAKQTRDDECVCVAVTAQFPHALDLLTEYLSVVYQLSVSHATAHTLFDLHVRTLLLGNRLAERVLAVVFRRPASLHLVPHAHAALLLLGHFHDVSRAVPAVLHAHLFTHSHMGASLRALASCLVALRAERWAGFVGRLLNENLIRLSATVANARPVLVLILALIHLPSPVNVCTNFTYKQCQAVLALCLPYTNPSNFDLSLVALAYHAIFMWFVQCRVEWRHDLGCYIVSVLKRNRDMAQKSIRIHGCDASHVSGVQPISHHTHHHLSTQHEAGQFHTELIQAFSCIIQRHLRDCSSTSGILATSGSGGILATKHMDEYITSDMLESSCTYVVCNCVITLKIFNFPNDHLNHLSSGLSKLVDPAHIICYWKHIRRLKKLGDSLSAKSDSNYYCLLAIRDAAGRMFYLMPVVDGKIVISKCDRKSIHNTVFCEYLFKIRNRFRRFSVSSHNLKSEFSAPDHNSMFIQHSQQSLACKYFFQLFEKEVLMFVHSEMTLVDANLANDVIENLDHLPSCETHSVGVVYLADGQSASDLNAILANSSVSPNYQQFLLSLGDLFELRSCDRNIYYLGGLSSSGSDGDLAIIWRNEIMQMIFHVATLMPNRATDPAANSKRRLIGNDFVLIVFDDTLDSGVGGDCGAQGRFRVDTLSTQLLYACVCVRRVSRVYYELSIECKPMIQELFQDRARAGVYTLSSVGVAARILALEASLASQIYRSGHRRPHTERYAVNWLERLRSIKLCVSRCSAVNGV